MVSPERYGEIDRAKLIQKIVDLKFSAAEIQDQITHFEEKYAAQPSNTSFHEIAEERKEMHKELSSEIKKMELDLAIMDGQIAG